MTCPRCGCPAYRVQGHTKTFDARGQLTTETLCSIASCCRCGLEQHRLPGMGVVSTYPGGPFEDGDAA